MRIREGSIDIEVPDWVYYNPKQWLSRDILVAIAKAEGVKRFCEPFAAIGIRSLRLFIEAGIESALINDINEKYLQVAREILSGYNVEYHNKDARVFLWDTMSEPCDLVDVDQFGSPWQYIDAAIMATRPGGILTFIIPHPGTILGTYPTKCLRIHGSYPTRSRLRYEWGPRIALLTLSRRAAVFDRHIEPLMVFRHEYYYRFVVRIRRGVRDVEMRRLWHDDVNFRILHEPSRIGPAYGGRIFDYEFISNLIERAPSDTSKRFLHQLLAEARAPPLYYDVHKLSGKLRMNPPKMKRLVELGGIRTHFYKYGIRFESIEKLIKVLISLRP